jgi:MarR family transcriptional regulator for hemolysin
MRQIGAGRRAAALPGTCVFSKLAYNKQPSTRSPVMKPQKNELNNSFGFLIHDVARLMRWNFDRQSADTGLTRAQWSVLAYLRRSDGVQQKTLAALMDIKPISLARHIDRLEAEGWVERRDDPEDRRAKRVFLLPKAAPMLIALSKLGKKVRGKALNGISKEDEARICDILMRIRDNLSDSGNSNS